MAKNPSHSKNNPGRPRSEKARANILKAAIELLTERGLAAVTVDAIAKHANVGRPTIYRYWPNAHAVAMTALMESHPIPPAHKSPNSAVAELRRQLKRVIAAFTTPAGRSAAALIASADNNTEIAKTFRSFVILKSRNEGRRLLKRARENGEIAKIKDEEAILDMLYGPIFFRLLLGHQPLEKKFANTLLDVTVSGLAT